MSDAVLDEMTDQLDQALQDGDIEEAKNLIRKHKLLRSALKEVHDEMIEEKPERYVGAKKGKDWRPIKDPETLAANAVQASKEPNQFVDNGTDHQDDRNKTPDITRTERRPPSEMKMVDAVCWVCDRTERIESYRLTATGKFDSGENKGKSAYRCTNCCKSDRR